MTFHVPVLLKECMDGLQIRKGGTYVDATFGGGGHSMEILSLLEEGKLFSLDQDQEAWMNKIEDGRWTLVRANFRDIISAMKREGVEKVDGILADLGISSRQIDEGERGFSIRLDGPLDMRMNRDTNLTAEVVVNEYDEKELSGLLREYGEIINAGKVTGMILKARKESRIDTTGKLAALMKRIAPRGKENQFMAQVFQAIRIEVNDELGALEDLLTGAEKLIRKGGRLVIISYHSLEDRMVKSYMKKGNTEGRDVKDLFGNKIVPFEEITRKPLVPGEAEIMKNNRARSARLRIGEKT